MFYVKINSIQFYNVVKEVKMIKYVFTICSNNYLAQAKTLGDSVLKYNPEYKFIIALCDKLNENIDYSVFSNFEIIEAHNLEIPEFEQMKEQYNIVEFNTSIKPFVFKYIFKHYNADIAMYIDPDLMAFKDFSCIEDELKTSSILLTPHIYRPIELDDKTPDESTFTNYGIYNLGFLAVKKSADTDNLLNWWSDRMAKNCYVKPERGIFVDQLPMNYAPLFFNNVKITLNEGINAAPWNLQERNITLKDGKYIVNDKFDLVLYHFSNYNPLTPDIVAKHYIRVGFKDNPVLKQLYDNYAKILIQNGYEKYKQIKCFYSSELSNWEVKSKETKPDIKKYMIKHPLFLFRKGFWELIKK